MIKRILENKLSDCIDQSNKIIVVYGARHVGKTTLIKNVLNSNYDSVLEINGSEKKYQSILSDPDVSQLKRLISGYKILFIDEAPSIQKLGSSLKILHENFPELKIIVSCSFSLKPGNQFKEIAHIYNLYPFSILEFEKSLFSYEIDERLQEFLIFGMYPKVLSFENEQEKMNYLKALTQSYLYKDLYELTRIKNTSKIYDLLQLLAFRIGTSVSYNELGRRLKLSTDTVISYIDWLEKIFIVFRLDGFSKNLSKEMTNNKKVYFYDVGVRNAFIEDFRAPDKRYDTEQLWENFIISERIKRNQYLQKNINSFFWRTYTGAKLDYVEKEENNLSGYKILWEEKKARVPQTWMQTYTKTDFNIINKLNYKDFVT